MSFFRELKRRNVFKVAAAYIIISWLIMQAGEVMGPALRLPDWANSLLAFFLILGFPLAMFFAWAFEITPEGLKKEKEVEKSQSITLSTGRKLNFTIVALLVLALGYFIWESRFQPGDVIPAKAGTSSTTVIQLNPSAQNVSAETSDEPTPDKKSIAVIPFRNRSANEENAAFFSDGVHDELLTNLAKISALKVISRTSVMSYRDTTKNLRQIGEELGVANILEGGVQRAGDKVRINVQLIDAATDEHLWAKVYDRQLTAENIFSIQTEIALAIANALEATLSPREQELLAAKPTSNLEAFDNLLIASQLIDRSNWQSLRDAQSFLEKVIELDPKFTRAYVLLSEGYSQLFLTGAVTLQEIGAPWEQAVQTALSLDQNSASAHAAHATFLWLNNMEGADLTFQKARQLNPANAEIMVMYGTYLRKNSRPDSALKLYQMAKQYNPRSISVLFGLARSYEATGELNKALAEYAAIRKIDPTSQAGLTATAGPYFIMGKLDQAYLWIFRGMVADPDDFEIPNWIVRAYLDFGDLERARRWLSWVERTYDTGPMTLSSMAMLRVYEGNLDAAAQLARQALAAKAPNRWGSEVIMVRVLLLQAIKRGNAAPALEIIRQVHPELFESIPRVDAGNATQAIDAAYLLQMDSRYDEANELLLAVNATISVPYIMQNYMPGSGRAQVLALLGKKQAAIKELRLQVDKGQRLFWRWDTQLNPNFESLREDPEFQAIVEFLRTDIARQFQLFKVMEARGEIPSPPTEEDD